MTLNELLQTNKYTALTVAEAHELLHRKRHAVLVEFRGSYLGLASQVEPDSVRRLIQSVDLAAETDPLVREIQHFLRSDSGVDLSHPTTRAFLDGFAANVALPLTADDARSIKALAETMQSDAEKYDWGNVRMGQIQEARRNQ